jgi:capsule polysaccharide export protein KpsE/RkpR
MGNSMTVGGALSSIVSAFGFDINNMQSNDAITPLLYPDLMEDNGFVTSLFNVKVVSEDKEINTNYHDYLQKYQKGNIWLTPITWVKKLIKSLTSDDNDSQGGAGKADPYHLQKNEDDIANAIRANISFGIDKKTGVITITAKAQDPLICKTMADSVKERLQAFITDYRTSKARIDYEYYKNITKEAKQEYDDVCKAYGKFSDSNINVSLKSLSLKMASMENEMQMKYNTYTTFNAQMEVAEAKIQERTPAFTVIKGASVPLKASSPKRMIFVLGMVFLSVICTLIYIFIDEIKRIAATH